MYFTLLCACTVEQTDGASVKIEFLLSVIAIIISIGSIFFEYFWNQKINRTNLEADFFKDIYGVYLMKKIPEARRIIHYNNNNISDTDDLIRVLNEIRQDSLFYKYKDKDYYKLLCKNLQGLEDKLVEKTGRMSDDDYAEFIQEINTDIENIYDIIMRKYVGKTIKRK